MTSLICRWAIHLAGIVTKMTMRHLSDVTRYKRDSSTPHRRLILPSLILTVVPVAFSLCIGNTFGVTMSPPLLISTRHNVRSVFLRHIILCAFILSVSSIDDRFICYSRVIDQQWSWPWRLTNHQDRWRHTRIGASLITNKGHVMWRRIVTDMMDDICVLTDPVAQHMWTTVVNVKSLNRSSVQYKDI